MAKSHRKPAGYRSYTLRVPTPWDVKEFGAKFKKGIATDYSRIGAFGGKPKIMQK